MAFPSLDKYGSVKAFLWYLRWVMCFLLFKLWGFVHFRRNNRNCSIILEFASDNWNFGDLFVYFNSIAPKSTQKTMGGRFHSFCWGWARVSFFYLKVSCIPHHSLLPINLYGKSQNKWNLVYSGIYVPFLGWRFSVRPKTMIVCISPFPTTK